MAETGKGSKGIRASRGVALGERLTQLRRENKWTLGDVAARTGVGVSTLSKIENNQGDVTFETLMKLCDGLDLSLRHLTKGEPETFRSGARTITKRDDALIIDTAPYHFEVMSTELSRKGMIPTVVTVKARSIDDFAEMNRHPGEEFIYVVRGTLKLYTEFYQPAILEAGDSAHYDSSMQHAFVSVGPEDAVVLSVSHDSSESLSGPVGHLANLLDDAAVQ
ncbi:helix-turn-helix domain-containing protein [Sphingosinicella soli]|nr:XRE family transcriptional regulator [Sphingosinicella soli]